MSRQLAEQRGRKGERFASLWLLLQGWRTVAKRVKTPRGEIDLIVRRGNTVAFVEVKWRAKAADLDYAIDEYRLRRVAAAVEAVAHNYAEADETVRIDVMLLAPGQRPRHIVNAWQP
ncbi:YraN family protein [Altererythrobacter aquiaggeris]|uniref:YraN family protein n=1 Tax=Aestuarierythrobacter aquiaggeris TaxID=1898396 RepID=UPI003017FF07